MPTRIQAVLLLAAAALLGACGTTANPGDADDRSLLHTRAQAAMEDFKANDASLPALLNSPETVAYVVFPRIITGAAVAGGAYGQGEVYQKGKLVGYADVSQGSIGLQLGGQKYGELIVFRREVAFVDFTHSTYELDVRASAIAVTNGAASTADYSKGVAIFTLPESGVMAQAALGVQKFRYTPGGP